MLPWAITGGGVNKQGNAGKGLLPSWHHTGIALHSARAFLSRYSNLRRAASVEQLNASWSTIGSNNYPMASSNRYRSSWDFETGQ